MTVPLHADRVRIPTPRGSSEAYLARPDDGSNHPGIILIHEASGLDHNMTGVTRRLAEEGFVVLAPDLFHGEIATSMQDAMRLTQGLDTELALEVLTSAVEYLRGLDAVEPKRPGVVGFCMGGRLTWLLAEDQGDQLAAIAPFYAGRFNPTPEDIDRVTAPVLVVWGSEDHTISAENRQHIITLLENAGKLYKPLVYPAGHAFMTPAGPNYNEEASREVWPELVDWLKHYVSNPPH